MGEIKFRVWDSYGKRLIVINTVDQFMFLVCPILFSESKDVLQRYTGLKDKNGKEIWEGDIISYKNEMRSRKSKVRHKLLVEIPDIYIDIYPHDFSNSNMDTDSIEVIGNIYETPELLEKQ